MAFNGSGTYDPLTPPTFPAVAGTTILAADYNSQILDMAAALSLTLTRDGQATWTGDQNVGTRSLTNVGGITRTAASVTTAAGGPVWTLYSSPNLSLIPLGSYPDGEYTAFLDDQTTFNFTVLKTPPAGADYVQGLYAGATVAGTVSMNATTPANCFLSLTLGKKAVTVYRLT